MCFKKGPSVVWRGRLPPGESDGGQVPNQRGSSGGAAVPELSPGEGAVRSEKHPGHSEPGVWSHAHPTAAGIVTDTNSQMILNLHQLTLLSLLPFQSQISVVTEKLSSVQSMIRNREQCLRKLADVQVRPIQLVAPRPEPDQTSQRCKSPLFSPKHGTTPLFWGIQNQISVSLVRTLDTA